ncbi:hypothetical protein F383_12406 [Gossypium arboreum]|uniref:Uncharacterized protein n=1 Tax=Gossypium arboreum TaxID=29729 RepID=A0A0B0NGY2_GOSAR|nr:hypothetical protein F383_12406 [Gossypium arboreum]
MVETYARVFERVDKNRPFE